MRRLSLALISAVSAVAFAQIASAADLPRKAPVYAPPPPPPVYNWTGFYVGGLASYAWGRSQHCDAGICEAPGEIYPDFDINGWLGGITLGYNWQLANWVFGVEGDWSWGKVKGSSADTPDFGCGNLCLTEVKSIGTVRGRVGYAFDRLLPYLTAGVAFSRIHASIGNPVEAEDTTTETSFVGGGGLEYAFAPNWSAKIEYLYISKLGDFDYDHVNNCGPEPNCFARTHHLNVVRVGVNYRFWGGL
jgi:outer membrane immunogenic protein